MAQPLKSARRTAGGLFPSQAHHLTLLDPSGRGRSPKFRPIPAGILVLVFITTVRFSEPYNSRDDERVHIVLPQGGIVSSPSEYFLDSDAKMIFMLQWNRAQKSAVLPRFR